MTQLVDGFSLIITYRPMIRYVEIVVRTDEIPLNDDGTINFEMLKVAMNYSPFCHAWSTMYFIYEMENFEMQICNTLTGEFKLPKNYKILAKITSRMYTDINGTLYTLGGPSDFYRQLTHVLNY